MLKCNINEEINATLDELFDELSKWAFYYNLITIPWYVKIKNKFFAVCKFNNNILGICLFYKKSFNINEEINAILVDLFDELSITI